MKNKMLAFAIERAGGGIEPREVLATKAAWETNEYIRDAFPDAERWAKEFGPH